MLNFHYITYSIFFCSLLSHCLSQNPNQKQFCEAFRDNGYRVDVVLQVNSSPDGLRLYLFIGQHLWNMKTSSGTEPELSFDSLFSVLHTINISGYTTGLDFTDGSANYNLGFVRVIINLIKEYIISLCQRPHPTSDLQSPKPMAP